MRQGFKKDTFKAICTGCALVFALTGAILIAPAPVLAQDLGGLTDRLDRLERDIQTLNLQLAGRKDIKSIPMASGSSVASGPATARIAIRMDQLEGDLRNVTGTIEDLTFKITNLHERLDKLVSDIDFRLTSLEGGSPSGQVTKQQQGTLKDGDLGLSAAPVESQVKVMAPVQGTLGFASPPGTLGTVSAEAANQMSKKGEQLEPLQAQPANQPPAKPVPQAQTVVATPAPTGILPAGAPRDQYKFAFGLLRQADYARAEAAFKEFITANTNDPLISNAHYWLGETYYVRKSYVDAAGAFLEGYQSNTTGGKAPDTLLKLGMSLANLDKKTEACAAFEKVIIDFPKVSRGIRSKVEREQKNNGCN